MGTFLRRDMLILEDLYNACIGILVDLELIDSKQLVSDLAASLGHGRTYGVDNMELYILQTTRYMDVGDY
jgi:hypothetical protein